eukprot:TRINITY_DN53509_c0_g1_i1.p1 TRINITY_DN53509_c0_g1~~TRINITY_DN53509_c0_g1_i1.p1  ORF type:complete len:296 (+),score=17.24 TRINITY_DN53509_c0_g1_i1:85-972(+)
MALAWKVVCILMCAQVSIALGKSAFLIVDVQDCFLTGGTLPVGQGEEVIPVINEIRRKYSSYFDYIVRSQDWHCDNHISFASSHSDFIDGSPAKQPFDVVDLQYNQAGFLCRDPNNRWFANKGAADNVADCAAGEGTNVVSQTLWPDHCIIDTADAEFDERLATAPNDLIIQKGYRCYVDSYSVFLDNGDITSTGLHQMLQDRGVDTVYLAGLARDFCPYFSAIDAVQLGYKTYFILDATRGILPETSNAAVVDMVEHGVKLVRSQDLGDALKQEKNEAGSWQVTFNNNGGCGNC